jgi:hypothetical protein
MIKRSSLVDYFKTGPKIGWLKTICKPDTNSVWKIAIPTPDSPVFGW